MMMLKKKKNRTFIKNLSNLLVQHTVEVLNLLSDDVETDDAGPGENLKLRLKGIEEEEILPGFILCSPDSLCHSGRTFDAQVSSRSYTAAPGFITHVKIVGSKQHNLILGLFQIVIIEHKSIICPGYNAVLHIHTCIEEVQITVSPTEQTVFIQFCVCVHL